MVNEENILMKALYDMDLERIKSILKQGFDVNEPYNKHGWQCQGGVGILTQGLSYKVFYQAIIKN